MAWLSAILRELLGLVVDDGSLVVAVLVWVAALWVGLPRLGVPPAWGGILLFVGLALILAESVARRARL